MYWCSADNNNKITRTKYTVQYTEMYRLIHTHNREYKQQSVYWFINQKLYIREKADSGSQHNLIFWEMYLIYRLVYNMLARSVVV